MKIIFVLPFLSGIGGIQSSLLNLISEISTAENQIDVCVFGNFISDNTSLPKSVTVLRGPRLVEFSYRDFATTLHSYSLLEKFQFVLVKLLTKLIGNKNILRIALAFYKIHGSYDVAVAYTNDIHQPAYIGGANDIVKKCIVAKRKIGWIHNNPTVLGFSYDNCKKSYTDFDYIVNVSNACKAIFDEIIPEFVGKSKVVYNLLNIEKIGKLCYEPNPYQGNNFKFVSIGRINNPQKRIDRVVDCCEKLKLDGINNFKWYIVGDGPDTSWLLERVKEKGLEDTVIFVGRQNNPYPYMKYADALVMTSDYEAYSMVLIECLNVGTPIICTHFPGAEEIVQDGVNGMLVDVSTAGVLNAVNAVITNTDILKNFRENIRSHKPGNDIPLRQFWSVMRNE